MEIIEIYNKFLYKLKEQGWWPLFNENTGKFEYNKGNYDLPSNYRERFEISLGAILTFFR